jgi:high-affinity K+ transport system ATPase subunit B
MAYIGDGSSEHATAVVMSDGGLVRVSGDVAEIAYVTPAMTMVDVVEIQLGELPVAQVTTPEATVIVPVVYGATVVIDCTDRRKLHWCAE